jgi:hypothetical protein
MLNSWIKKRTECRIPETRKGLKAERTESRIFKTRRRLNSKYRSRELRLGHKKKFLGESRIPNAELDFITNTWLPNWAEWQNLECRIWQNDKSSMPNQTECRIQNVEIPNDELGRAKSIFLIGASEKLRNLPRPLFRPRFTNACQQGSNPCRHPVPFFLKLTVVANSEFWNLCILYLVK